MGAKPDHGRKTRLADRIVRASSYLVPAGERRRWLRQWSAELSHRRRMLEHSGDRGGGEQPSGTTESRRRQGLIRWSFGAVRHALWVRGSSASLAAPLRDARYATRALLRSPTFALTAVLTLAVGLGASTTMFSVVNAVLLRPLPFPEPERLVNVWQINNEWLASDNAFFRGMARRFPASFPVFEQWRDRARVFDGVVAVRANAFTVTGSELTERIIGVGLSGDVHRVVGVEPALGRWFTPDEDRVGGPRVAVISHGFWQRQLGGAADVLGRTIVLDDTAHTVIGVAPADFAFPDSGYEVWRSASDAARTAGWDSQGLQVIARLAPDIDLPAAQRDMATFTARLTADNPDAGDVGVRLVPRLDELVGSMRPTLMILLTAAGLVLVVACANVANLMLVRGADRRRELALRAALGAGAGQLGRQLLIESLLVSGAGCALGVLAAGMALGPLRSIVPPGPRIRELALDPTVIGFAAVLALTSAILVGLVPALRLLRHSPAEALQEGGRAAAGGRSQRLQSAFVIAEIAVSVVLLTGAGLLLNSLWRLQSVDPGFELERRLTFKIDVPEAYPEYADAIDFVDRALQRFAALPSVVEVAATDSLPFAGGSSSGTLVLEGRESDDETEYSAQQARVSPGYFETLSIPLVRGRPIAATDHLSAAPVAVINEAMAQAFWPDEDPVGARLKKGDAEQQWTTVVGVVADVKHGNLAAEVRPMTFFPYRQRASWEMTFVVRTAGPPLELLDSVRGAMREVDPSVPIYSVGLLEDFVRRSARIARFRTVLLASLASIALFLAVVGVYGVMSYAVSRRTREIGVRIALGARQQDVVSQVTRRGALLALAGTAIGVAGALAGSRVLSTFLYGVGGSDPVTYTLAVALLLIVAAIACAIPARRAARVDPVIALQAE